MGLTNINECPCPDKNCKYYSNCQACALHHKKNNTLPHCLFIDNDGDPSLENFYKNVSNRPNFNDIDITK